MKSALGLFIAMALPAVGEVSITSFADGHLTVSNAVPDGTRVFYSVEWRPSLQAETPWTGDWSGFTEVALTNAVSNMSVPTFFRVAAFPDNLTTDPAELWQMYSNAVLDASNAVPTKIARNLTPVLLSDSNLAWRTNSDGVVQVKVCGFMSAAMTSRYQPGKHTPNSGDLWVTLYPQLKEFCQSFHGPDQVLRVKELLGISPQWAYDTVVEFWVSPDVLYRTAADPAISSISAAAPSSTVAPYLTANTRVNANWTQWFNNTYDLVNYGMVGGIYGRVWTRLGYTYDWASTRPNHQGLSEYVVPSGMLFNQQGYLVNIEVEALVPAATYGRVVP